MRQTLFIMFGALSWLADGANCQATTEPLNIAEWGQASITRRSEKSGVIELSVPLTITSLSPLAAAVIPLSFGAGQTATLREVEFDPRFGEGDFTIANIYNESGTALIAIISMATDLSRSNLGVGSSTVATLHFELEPSSKGPLLLTIEPSGLGHQLAFVDNGPQGGETAVRQMQPETRALSIDVVAAGASPLPKQYLLEQNYPNPFNAGTVITFDLAEAADWRLTIHNVLGQTIRDFSGDNEVGRVSVTWDGRTDTGGAASSGVYFYRVSANGFVATKKMALVK